MTKIGADDLTYAAHGHMERTSLIGPDPIARIIEEIGVDASEFQTCMSTLKDLREGMSDEDFGAWAAGVVDGFVIGVRAARGAAD